MSEPKEPSLRRGWTTGACASGAARAAFEGLLTGAFPDPVPVALPKGLRPEFALASHELGRRFRPRRHRQGRGRRSGCHPWRACHRERKRSDSEMKGRGGGSGSPRRFAPRDDGNASRSPGASFALPARTGAEAAHVVGVVEFAVAKIVGAERWADQDQRRALDRRRAQRAGKFAERRAHDALVRP